MKTITGLEFLECAVQAQTPDGCTDCDDCGCCAVEKSQYKSDHARITIPSPDLLPLLPTALADITNRLCDEASAADFAGAQPELPQCWQFVFRAASPPRAPSFVS